jgi:hypothetical protein
MEKRDALSSLRPYEKEPTEEEINAEMIRLQNEYDSLQYQRDRYYPTWQEQMDMQYHDQLNGTTTWKDAIAKVKADNPKTKGK